MEYSNIVHCCFLWGIIGLMDVSRVKMMMRLLVGDLGEGMGGGDGRGGMTGDRGDYLACGGGGKKFAGQDWSYNCLNFWKGMGISYK